MNSIGIKSGKILFKKLLTFSATPGIQEIVDTKSNPPSLKTNTIRDMEVGANLKFEKKIRQY